MDTVQTIGNGRLVNFQFLASFFANLEAKNTITHGIPASYPVVDTCVTADGLGMKSQHPGIKARLAS